MMLRIGLRFHRTGMISTAAIGAFSGMLQSLGFQAIVGTSESARQQFGLQMQLLGRQLSYLVPLPVHPETLAGYVQWRAFGFFPVIFGFWALIAGSGAIRGDEERGLLELWLASGTSRARVTAARTGAFVIAAAASILIVLLLTAAGHAGKGKLAEVTSIQRVHTMGGQPPAAAECNASKTNTEARSSYTADYYFYAPGK